MQKNDKDWGKIIIRIALLLFIIFFISRWFADSRDETAPSDDSFVSLSTDNGSETTSSEADLTDTETGTGSSGTEAASADIEEPLSSYIEYRFRNRNLLDKHYDKHGIEMGFASAAEYEAAACAVANNPKALHKLEQEDGDDVYYIEDTGEFVVISTDGFIRTYYYADKAYFDRQ